jgi:predicted N-acetyltransferase YhbS
VSEIRALEREDLPQVAGLVELAFRSGSKIPPPGLATYLERLLLGHPWVDPEIPSLVAVDETGQIVGCLGSHIRRFRYDGEPIRVAVSGQLVVDPVARRRAVGAFLMRRYLDGPQDLSLTDTASVTARRMWERFGGTTVHLGRIGWVRLFRPLRFATEYLLKNHDRWRPAAASALAPFDAVSARLTANRWAIPRTDVVTEPLAPGGLVAALPPVLGSVRFRPDYDVPFLEWLFEELAAVRSRGLPTGFVLRDRSGRTLGWYLYFLRRGGISQVVQIVANERDIAPVVDHLLEHARMNGAAALQGRVEPGLIEILAERGCLLHASGYRVLVHARDDGIVHAIDSGDAVLSRLDGDWWTGLHLESFSSPRTEALETVPVEFPASPEPGR